MSQAKKHVEWCLRKAESEMKGGDHKGLIKRTLNNSLFLMSFKDSHKKTLPYSWI